jgi:hypothetical protein
VLDGSVRCRRPLAGLRRRRSAWQTEAEAGPGWRGAAAVGHRRHCRTSSPARRRSRSPPDRLRRPGGHRPRVAPGRAPRRCTRVGWLRTDVICSGRACRGHARFHEDVSAGTRPKARTSDRSGRSASLRRRAHRAGLAERVFHETHSVADKTHRVVIQVTQNDRPCRRCPGVGSDCRTSVGTSARTST